MLPRVVTLLFVSIFVLSGCDLASLPVPPLSTTPVSDAPTAPELAASETTIAPVIITFADQSFLQPQYAPLIAAFESQNPDIRIQFVSLDDQIASFFTGTSPEAMARTLVSQADTMTTAFIAPQAYSDQYMYDLQPFIDADSTFRVDDFYPFAWNDDTAAYGRFMIPTRLSMQTMTYNRTLFANRNVPFPAEDASVEEVLAAAQAIADSSTTPPTIGLMTQVPAPLLLDALIKQGVDIRMLHKTGQSLPQPVLEEVFVGMQTLYATNVVTTDIDTTLEIAELQPMAQAILAGQVGIWDDTMLLYLPDLQPSFDTGSILVPLTPTASTLSTSGYAMSAGTQHPNEAWRWLSFLSAQLPIGLAPTHALPPIPARQSVTARSGVLESVPEELRAALERRLLTSRTPIRSDGAVNQGYGAVYGAFEAVLSQRLTPQQASEQAVEDFTTAYQTPMPTPDTSPIIVATPVPAPAVAAGAEIVQFGVTRFRAEAARQTAQQVTGDTISVQLTDLAAGSLATLAGQVDCFSAVAPLEEPDALLDVRPLLDADARGLLADLPAVVRQPLERDGRLYGLPLTVGVPTLNGNLALLDAAGVSLPDAGATPQDILALAQLLTRGGGPDRQYGYAAAGTLTADLDWWLRRSGISLVDATGQPTFTNPATLAAIDSFLTLLRDTSPHTRLSGASDDLLTTDGADAIAAGRVALWLGLPTSAPVAPADGAVVRGIAPTGTAGLTSADLDVRGGYVSARTAALTGCWAMLTALSANTTGLSSAPGGPLQLPARTSIATDAAFTSSLGDDGATLAAAATVALTRATAQPPADADLPRRWFYRAVDAALQGENLERELADAQDRTGAYLACVATGTALETCLADE